MKFTKLVMIQVLLALATGLILSSCVVTMRHFGAIANRNAPSTAPLTHR